MKIIILSSLFFTLSGAPQIGAQSTRPLKYYGTYTVQPADFATISQYHINTAVSVGLNINAGQSSWQPYFDAANRYNINIVVWPTGGSGVCGFPYNGGNISAAIYPLLDYLARQSKWIGIINAHGFMGRCF